MRETTTDADGQFSIGALTPGQLDLIATADGYLSTLYRPNLQSLPPRIAEGQQISGITLQLPRAATISGIVRDAEGRPVPSVEVRVFHRGILTVRRAWLGVIARFETDGNGRFVAGNLQPGEYLVSVPMLATTIPAGVVSAVRAVPRPEFEASPIGQSMIASRAPVPGPDFEAGAVDGVLMLRGQVNRAAPVLAVSGRPATTVFRTTYFPAATSQDSASIISVKSGDDRANVDITLQSARVFRVSGVLRRNGAPVSFTGIHLIAENAEERSNDYDTLAAWSVTDSAGEFTLQNVPPGRYSLKVVVIPAPAGQRNPLIPPADRVTAWASTPVTVGDRHVNVGEVQLRDPVTVSGEVVFSGAGAMMPAATGRSTVWMAAADGGMYAPPAAIPIGPDGRFVLKGAMSQRYHLWGGGYPGWSVVSVTAAGTDITGAALSVGDRDISDVRIVLSSRPVLVSGTVVDAAERPLTSAEVLVFPANYALWIANGLSNRVMRRVRSDPSGQFGVSGLPPGLYLVAALPEGAAADYPDRRLFETVAKFGQPVALVEGKPVNVRLTVGSR